MIECPFCKTIFTPRHRICPRCQKYEAKVEERIDYLADAAERALDEGASPAEVESMLVEEGVASLVAAEIVSTRACKVKRAERSYGLFRMVGGLIIIVAGIVTALIGVLFLPDRLGFRLLVCGACLALAGTYPFARGLYSVYTGRE